MLQKISHAFTLKSALSSSEDFSQLRNSTNEMERLRFPLYLILEQCHRLSSLFFPGITARIKQLSCFARDATGNSAADFSTGEQINLLYLSLVGYELSFGYYSDVHSTSLSFFHRWSVGWFYMPGWNTDFAVMQFCFQCGKDCSIVHFLTVSWGAHALAESLDQNLIKYQIGLNGSTDN